MNKYRLAVTRALAPRLAHIRTQQEADILVEALKHLNSPTKRNINKNYLCLAIDDVEIEDVREVKKRLTDRISSALRAGTLSVALDHAMVDYYGMKKTYDEEHEGQRSFSNMARIWWVMAMLTESDFPEHVTRIEEWLVQEGEGYA